VSDQNHDSNKKDSISIIYHQRNDSPKHFEIKRSRVYLFFIGLPTITLIALVIGSVGLVNTSPFHLLTNYRMASKTRANLSKNENLAEENAELKSEIAALQEQSKTGPSTIATTPAATTTSATTPGATQCPAPIACPASSISSTVNSIGLSTLSLFRPIQGQKDRTRPAVLNLSGFKAEVSRDNVNLKFNIIPAATDDSKISGHIIVLMKNELAIQAYPLQALGGNDFQINYSAGEPFATQRFRPVDAGFVKPRKSGNYSFTVFIFSRTGDLIHFQTVNIPLKL
jgi:hypothetical protein